MGHHTYPPTQGIMTGRWGTQGGGGYPTGIPPETGLAALGLSDANIHTFTSDLQGVVASGVGAALPSPYPLVTMGKVATLSLLHLRFVCGVAEGGDLPPIWEEVARGRGKMEGM